MRSTVGYHLSRPTGLSEIPASIRDDRITEPGK